MCFMNLVRVWFQYSDNGAYHEFHKEYRYIYNLQVTSEYMNLQTYQETMVITTIIRDSGIIRSF